MAQTNKYVFSVTMTFLVCLLKVQVLKHNLVIEHSKWIQASFAHILDFCSQWTWPRMFCLRQVKVMTPFVKFQCRVKSFGLDKNSRHVAGPWPCMEDLQLKPCQMHWLLAIILWSDISIKCVKRILYPNQGLWQRQTYRYGKTWKVSQLADGEGHHD